jgi:hypothetical protein
MKVLFIGNSHTYFNDMPGIFKRLCAEKGKDVHVTMLTKGGMGLDYHLKQEQTHFNIRYGEYDYVVLQHTAHPMGDLKVMHDAACALVKIIREAGSTPVFYQTWAKKGDEAFQSTMSGVYNDLGKELNVPVAPVGDEWQAYRLAHPEAEMYFKDGEHASPEGSALAARVILQTILNYAR